MLTGNGKTKKAAGIMTILAVITVAYVFFDIFSKKSLKIGFGEFIAVNSVFVFFALLYFVSFYAAKKTHLPIYIVPAVFFLVAGIVGLLFRSRIEAFIDEIFFPLAPCLPELCSIKCAVAFFT